MSVDHVQGGYIYYYGNLITSDANDSWAASVASSFWKVYGAGITNLNYPLYAFNNSFCGCGKAFANDAGTVGIRIKHFNNAYKFTKSSRTWMLTFWDSTNVFDYDVSSISWPASIVTNNQEAHGKISDPLFVNSQTYNLKLQPGSPAIDGGKVLNFPEFGWTQSFRGSAPDIGAYEGDMLIDGPAFRFMAAPELNLTYKERPRIVRSKIIGNKLDLYFSAPLDPSTVAAPNIFMREGDNAINILSATLLNDNYKMEIETPNQLIDSLVVFSFYQLPKGTNGECATLWGATINVDRNKVLTGIKESSYENAVSLHPSLNVYPNPFNNQTRIMINIPANYEGQKNNSLKIFNILGRQVMEINLTDAKGRTEISFNSTGLASGIYFVVLNVKQQIITQKIVLLK
jgi:hypothetical protein